MVTTKLSATAIHIPDSPRPVLDSSHEPGTLTSHCESSVNIIVIIVWPAPFITPLDMNIMPKNR